MPEENCVKHVPGERLATAANFIPDEGNNGRYFLLILSICVKCGKEFLYRLYEEPR